MRFNMIRFKMIARKRNHKKEEMTIGSAIKLKRHELGMTLEEASKNICSISYLSKLENNLIVPNEKYVIQLKQRFCIQENDSSYQNETYYQLKKQLSDALFHGLVLDESFKQQIGNATNYQTLLLKFGYEVLHKHDEHMNRIYHQMLPLITSMPDEEFSLLICLLSIELHRETRYQDANDLLAMIPSKHISDELLLFRDKWRLIHAIKMDNTALFHMLYPTYQETLMRLGFYQQIDELKTQKLMYFSNMMSVKTYQTLMQSYQHLSPQVFRYAKLCNLLANGYYDKVLQELHDINHDHDTSWIMMKLIALDGLNQSKLLCQTLHQSQHLNWSYRQKLMINFLKAKHQYDKKRLLLYLRTVILGEGFLTDDVIILKYLQHQAHALFRKYFYYKEATEVYIRFQQKIERLKKSNQLLMKEPIGSFVYV